MTPDAIQHAVERTELRRKVRWQSVSGPGDPGHTTVSLKRVDANTVEETDTRAGKVTDEIHLAAAADGKSINVTDKDLQHDQITTFTLDKQP